MSKVTMIFDTFRKKFPDKAEAIIDSFKKYFCGEIEEKDVAPEVIEEICNLGEDDN